MLAVWGGESGKLNKLPVNIGVDDIVQYLHRWWTGWVVFREKYLGPQYSKGATCIVLHLFLVNKKESQSGTIIASTEELSDAHLAEMRVLLTTALPIIFCSFRILFIRKAMFLKLSSFSWYHKMANRNIQFSVRFNTDQMEGNNLLSLNNSSMGVMCTWSIINDSR